jgi:hypothetical protein
VQRHPVADGAGDTGDRGGIVEVATRGRVGQQEMEPHEVDKDVDIGGRETHARGDVLDDLHADGGVIPGEPLADVVQERADEEQIGPFDPVGQLGGERRGLQQVPVDGVRVVRVALGLVAHGGPLGNEAHQEPVLVERFDLVDGGTTQPEQGDERLACLVRPRVARRGHAVGQAVQRAPGDRAVQPGGGRGEPQWQRRVVGDGREGRQSDLAVDLHHFGTEVDRRGRPARVGRAAAEATLGGWGRVPEPPPAPHVVADPGDLTAGRRDSQHECVSVGEAQRVRHLVLVLEQELVVFTLGQAVELDPDVSEQRGRALERCQVGIVGQQRGEGRDGAHDDDVAQPAMALLEVGLEEEGDITRGGAPLGHLQLEQGEVLGGEPVAPGGPCLHEERLGHPVLSPDEATIEEAEGDPGVICCRAQDLRGPAHRVIEVHALVPHRVPDAVSDSLDVAVAVVDEHHVEVAVRAQRAASVAAHCDQRQMSLAVARRPFGQAREPRIGLGGVARAEFLSFETRFGQQPAPPVTE